MKGYKTVYKPYHHVESGITFKTFPQVREYIWSTREHKSEISGKPLVYPNNHLFHHQFAHLLGRNYTYFVLNPDNIILLTADEHLHQEQYPEFLEKQEEMRQKYYQIYYGKEF